MKNLKKNILFLLVVFCFDLPLPATAQQDSVVLQGRLLDTAYEGATFTCKVILPGAPLQSQVAFSNTYSTKVHDGYFKLVLATVDEWFDVTFTLEDRKGRETLLNSGNIIETTYLFHKGDHSQLLLGRDGRFYFSGKGEARLNCQQNLYSLGNLPEGANAAVNDLVNTQRYNEACNARFNFLKLNIAMKRALLETYRDSLPQIIFNRLWLDVIGRTYGTWFYSLSVLARMHSPAVIKAAKVFLGELVSEIPLQDNSQAALNSSHYANSLFLKELVLLKYDTIGGATRKVGFREIYTTILHNYSGELRDKLIFLTFLNLDKSNMDAVNYLDEAIALMGNNVSKRMLLELKENIGKGSPAYPFDLPQDGGKRISLKDLYGKVIIADFWFNGCKGCAQIPPAMASVQKRYAENKNVVFLSINVDNQKKWWNDGLKTGIYTIPGSIHLSLFEQGKNHPFLKHYNYQEFPQLLVIDQKGKTVSANPPDPRIDQGNGLIDLVNSLLFNNSKNGR